jgi:acyl-CoA reductase-like NAD-dependent aldehyde dehydrogenase
VRIFRFIAAKKAEHSIKIMCRVLEVGVDDHDVGPLVSETQHGRVSQHVAAARSEDRARLVIGGGRPDGLDDGWFFEPTIFDVSTRRARSPPRRSSARS